MADFALKALFPENDPDELYSRRRDRHGPFGATNFLFTSASPGQGPFFVLLERSPADGLRLVRAVVERATEWRRDQYRESHVPFPRVSIPFPGGTKSFEGDFAIFHWSRSCPWSLVASALMALEAWGHRQIEGGRNFGEVLEDVLGPDNSSLAFVLVAIDLTLSHWREAREFAWPLVGTPEILHYDDARHTRDIVGGASAPRIAVPHMLPSSE